MGEEIMYKGRKFNAIFFTGEGVIRVGELGCIDIEVVHVNGQMAPVPWVEVSFKNKSSQLWNMAHLEGVE